MRTLIINRLKVVLVEKNRSSRWLAEQLRKDETTVSRWCTNISQPKLETLILIASLLDIDVRELLYPTKDKDK
ncbi:helix-turn-helix transcriptional regulator [Leptospira santarosai]|uniref:helix-turn-helix transcriptional regulator n=1 Tax=Leptospira santarosai TaxID=28183 RepID=UPI00035FADEB|nr:helix-turn-helix transcriptional regulator [Leptospira santarosai]